MHSATDAVQWVFEWSFGDSNVPVVVSVNVGKSDGHVFCGWIHWNDEDDFTNHFAHVANVVYLVSWRPGKGTFPTEGDLEWWARWRDLGQTPDDWLLADGQRFRSVPRVIDALHQHSGIPEETPIPGDWCEPSRKQLAWRAEYRADWNDIKRRNAASARRRRRG